MAGLTVRGGGGGGGGGIGGKLSLKRRREDRGGVPGILKLRILNPVSKHLIAEPRRLNGFRSQFITETEKPPVQEGVKTVRLKKEKNPFPQEKMTKMRHTEPFRWLLSRNLKTAKENTVENPKGGIRRPVVLEDEAFELS